jgi:[acyl-carrier-protein] S-malonyltransferase
MAPAAARLRAALDKVTLHAPKCPVLSNVTGVAHGEDPEAMKGLLVRQLTEGVRWAQNCSWILEAIPDGTFHELAPGKTLAGLMRRIDRGTKVVTHDEP